MKSLPARHQREGHWRYAEGLVTEAALSRSALRAADTQLRIALRAEGLGVNARRWNRGRLSVFRHRLRALSL